MRVLVVNAGSSSLKLRVVQGCDRITATQDIDQWSGGDQTPIERFVEGLPDRVDAVGHRVVHGGRRFTGPVRLDAATLDAIGALTELAPLHQARAVAAIEATQAVLARTPAVACFDTALHATMPEAAATYPLPTSWRERWGLRRYGFHGLSHSYVLRRAEEMAAVTQPRIVSCHLGAGASVAALHKGRSVDTTMGFTPLDGLMMATRSGSVDPGLVLWLIQAAGMDPDEVSSALERDSGLAAVAESPGGDMRRIRQAAHDGDRRAVLALEIYVHRLRAGISAMSAAMGGLDALVFTGGVGEHDPALRADTAAGLAFLGVGIDADRNADVHSDADISAAGSVVRTLVVTAREEFEIAEQTEHVLSGRS